MKLLRSALAGLVLALVSVTLAPAPAPALPASSAPPTFPIPWANSAASAYKRTIPQASQIGVQDGAASLTDGFPPLNFTPLSSGGVPPFGQDMNGILNELSANARWFNAGGPVVWSSTFSSSIGGYPAGAIVQSATVQGKLWLSTTDNNTTNPDTGGAGWTNAAVAALTYTPANRAGDTFTGGVAVGTNTAAQVFYLNGPAGSSRATTLLTAGVARWQLGADSSAESGSNAGSSLYLNRFNDAGTYLDTPVNVSRASGQVTANDGLQVYNGLIVNSSSGGANAYINAPTGTYRTLDYETAGLDRWHVAASGDAESGSNVGTNYQVQRFSDAGAYLDTPLSITRSTGLVTLNDGLAVNGGSLSVNGNNTLYMNGAAGLGRSVNFETAGVTRWFIGADQSTESGSNSGSNFAIGRYTDAGAWVDNPLYVTRSTGVVQIADGLTVSAGTTSIPAGSTTIPTFKIASGSLLTTPQAGAIENGSGQLYFTDNVPTRRTLAYADFTNVPAGGVALGKVATQATNTILGNNSGSTASPSALANTAVNSMLPGAAKAWAIITACSSGTCTIGAGYNVSTVTNPSTGHMVVTLTSALSSTSYAYFGMSSGQAQAIAGDASYTQTTTSFGLYGQCSNGNAGTCGGFTYPLYVVVFSN